jgi:putative DNA methylase
MKSILANIKWNRLGRAIRSETTNREVHQPLVSMYRWWARRPHNLIGAIIDAAIGQLGPSALIADPFSGGGTVAIEAASRAVRVYAQDINPWAAWGLKVSLSPVDPDLLASVGEDFLGALRDRRGEAFCPDHGDSRGFSHVHTFRVRVTTCGSCENDIWHFPYSLISLDSRSGDEKFGHFGCRRCGAVRKHRIDARRLKCANCSFEIHPIERENCPHCGATIGDFRGIGKVRWRIVLIQKRIVSAGSPRLEFSIPSEIDVCVAEGAHNLVLPGSVEAPIPDGQETRKLLRFGFSRWSDLYPRRQLATLIDAGKVLAALGTDEAIRDRLALCLAGTTEMPGFLCRWDRFHPKIFEALANHRFSFDGLAVEPNPLSSVGRGSLARRIASSVVAARWLREHVAHRPSVAYARTEIVPPRYATESGVTIVQGSSERILLRDRSASLILTDPPYYDCVRYGELASLFLSWMPLFGIAAKAGRFDLQREAVPSRFGRQDGATYEEKLCYIFAECSRVIAEDGRLILTYHSGELRAWSALGNALATNGFRIMAIAVAQTENGFDHSKRGKRSFLNDLLIECIHGPTAPPVAVLTRPRTPEQRELLHVGLSIAEVGSSDYSTLRAAFIRRTAKMKQMKISSARIAPRGALVL